VFDLDAAGAEFGHLGADVADLPRRLGLLVSGPDRALGQVQVGAAAAPEHDGVLVFPYDLQSELAVVELPGRGEVRGQQHGGDRMVTKHGTSLLLSGARYSAHAGWMLALWWNRFRGSYFFLIVASRWYLAGP